MQKEVRKSWALFTGFGIIMIAQGLQNNLMGIRAVIENFSTLTTGIFMSGFFVGYFFGSYTTPILISKLTLDFLPKFVLFPCMRYGCIKIASPDFKLGLYGLFNLFKYTSLM